MRKFLVTLCVLGCVNAAMVPVSIAEEDQPQEAAQPQGSPPAEAPQMPTKPPPPPDLKQQQQDSGPPPAQQQLPPEQQQETPADVASADVPPAAVQPSAPAVGAGPPPSGPLVAAPAQGQWVYTSTYGWIWVPYSRSYTYVDPAGELAFSYAYYPSYGWTWLASPWVLGWGPRPWWGARGCGGYYWYSHPWFRAGVYRPHVWAHYGRGPWGPRPISPVYAHQAPRVYSHPSYVRPAPVNIRPVYRPAPAYHPAPAPAFHPAPGFRGGGGFHGGGFHGGGGFHHR